METIHSSRKRVVGGFYVYDSHVEQQALGTLCQGKSDAQGLLDCQVSLNKAGDVQLQAVARDAEGHASVVERALWVSDQAHWWFGGGNHDRIDIIPEKRVYAPGETARFQVRMPFREATALVAVEREGIIRTQVVELKGDDPTVSLKVEEGWTPNVYVSVLALRGRLRDVPWYSFFGWGWRHPGRWWDAWWQDDRQYQAPTAGGPEQAGLPLRHGRDPRGGSAAPAGREASGQSGKLSRAGARPGGHCGDPA